MISYTCADSEKIYISYMYESLYYEKLALPDVKIEANPREWGQKLSAFIHKDFIFQVGGIGHII